VLALLAGRGGLRRALAVSATVCANDHPWPRSLRWAGAVYRNPAPRRTLIDKGAVESSAILRIWHLPKS